MARYVAFLRAINVGGRVVKMEALRKIVASAEVSDVSTFIASGNLLFDAATRSPAALEQKLAAVLERALGYEVATFIRSADEIDAIVAYRPFGAAESDAGSLFVIFLPEPLTSGEKKIVASLESPVDALRVRGREVYWHARNNFRDAQFSPARMEKLLGKAATFRNLTTVRKIAALLRSPA